MSNIFEKIWHGIEDVLLAIPKLVTKYKSIVSAEQQALPEFVESTGAMVSDLADFAEKAAKAVNDKGINWNEDKDALAAAEKLIADFPAFVKAIEANFKTLQEVVA